MKTFKDAGKGRKQCPNCKIYIAARTGVCPDCDYELTEGAKAAQAAVQEKANDLQKRQSEVHDTGGRGRRQCHGCKKYYGVRLKVCPGCGVAAVKVDKVAEITVYDEPGKRRKQCPDCNKYVGFRAEECVCGHIFEAEAVKEEIPSITTYEEGGSHRKECPCGKFVNKKNMECVCGHKFEEAPVSSVTNYKPSEMEIEASRAKQRCGCSCLLILAPAGACPVKLTSTDPDHVADWANNVISTGHQQGKHFSPSAIRYYVRTFYDMGSPEYDEVINVLALEAPLDDYGDSDGDSDDEFVDEDGELADVDELAEVE